MPVRLDLATVDAPGRRDTLVPLPPAALDVRTRALAGTDVRTAADHVGDTLLMTCGGRAAVVGRDGEPGRQTHPCPLLLSVVAGGRSGREQGNAASVVSLGDIVVYSSSGPDRATGGHLATHTYVLDRDALGLPDGVAPVGPARRIDRGHPLGPIVSSYLAQLATHAVELDARQRADLERPTLDLVRSLLTATATATAGDGDRVREPLHDSLGVRIVEYLRTHVTDRDLSVAQVARHHDISERYTYLILSRFGITFSDWVRRHRLQGAATDLLDPRTARDGVSVIAFRWGFPDHANFTRSFTRHFGVSPREFRRRSTAG